MNVLSLFSGIGGLDLGLQRAGMTIAGQVEIDPWCRRVLAKHWPEVPRHDDVRTCAEWWGARGAPDLVCGGFPCQPVSVAGKKLGQADSRWLWPAFCDVICDLRPRFALVENVPGLLGRGMGDVLGDLATIGYDAEWDCVPAAFVGAPHIRERVFVVAYPHREPVRVRAGGVPSPARAREGEEPQRQRVRADARHGGTAVADSASERQQWREDLEGSRRHPAIWRQTVDLPGNGGDQDGRGHWDVEPRLGRLATGVPGRVDRLRGLGNAVVPQVAEYIGRMIMDAAP